MLKIVFKRTEDGPSWNVISVENGVTLTTLTIAPSAEVVSAFAKVAYDSHVFDAFVTAASVYRARVNARCETKGYPLKYAA